MENLEPKPVFHFFEQICAIPHTSRHEKALSDYCVEFAKERGLEYHQDEMGNVIVISPATPGYEQEPPLIVQGHLDMVGDQEEGCSLDLLKDGLRLRVNGDFIEAEGTTLGGDDGIAIAFLLAALDDASLPHPRLEAVMTVCEEIGLLGATAMDLSPCQARRMVNIDSEAEGILTVGCAGGRRVFCRIPVQTVSEQGFHISLTLTGLKGGHSGMEIHQGRANACIEMGRFLQLLRERTAYGLCALSGGVKENVIPKSASAQILLPPESEEAFDRTVEEFLLQMRTEYGTADPEISLSLEKGEPCEGLALNGESLALVLDALNLMPNGVQSMSADLPGQVETSLNMGTMELTPQEFLLRISVRSSVASAKEQTVRKVRMLTNRLGGTVEFSGDYPAWPYAKDSKLRQICEELFEKQYGHKPEVTVIHAGLECGIFSDKLKGLDCISIGPDLCDVHTPREHMSISSVARTWEYLKAILAYRQGE